MKQTAVYWLIKEINILLGPLETRSIQDILIIDAIEQAKVMEKEQIIDAITYFHGRPYSELDAEQYYNETFK